MTRTLKFSTLALTLSSLTLPLTGCGDEVEDLDQASAESCDLEDDTCDEEFRGSKEVAMTAIGMMAKLVLKSAYEKNIEAAIWPAEPVTLANSTLQEIATMMNEVVSNQFWSEANAEFETLFDNYQDYTRSVCAPEMVANCAASDLALMTDNKIAAVSLLNDYLLVDPAKILQGAHHIQAMGSLELKAQIEMLHQKERRGDLDVSGQASNVADSASDLLDTYLILETKFESEIDSRFSSCEKHNTRTSSYCLGEFLGWCHGGIGTTYHYDYRFDERGNGGQMTTHSSAEFTGDGSAELAACNANLASTKDANRATAKPLFLTDFDENTDLLEKIYTDHVYYGLDVSMSRQPCVPRGVEVRLENDGGPVTHSLVWQYDGNLVLYRHGVGAMWASHTAQTGDRLCFQGDGNLVIYGQSGAIWATHTWVPNGVGGTSLNVKASGNVTIEDTDGKIMWETNTGINAPR